jgi:inner membrane protein YidH
MTIPSVPSDPSTVMAATRTDLAFQRTRLSADRTLMAVIRTSMALISFGFTIHQIFQRLKGQNVLTKAAEEHNFGSSLVLLGIAMLVLGMLYHLHFMTGLRRAHDEMKRGGLIQAESGFPPSLTLIFALVLLLIGILVIVSMLFHVGPFR